MTRRAVRAHSTPGTQYWAPSDPQLTLLIEERPVVASALQEEQACASREADHLRYRGHRLLGTGLWVVGRAQDGVGPVRGLI